MALNNNPTPNEVVKEVKRLESDKVDKTNYKYQVYTTDSVGNQNTTIYGITANAGYIVQRAAKGQILVPKTPTSTDHATSKTYVDTGLAEKLEEETFASTTEVTPLANYYTKSEANTLFNAKVDKTSSPNMVYGTDGKGNQKTYFCSNVPQGNADCVVKTLQSGEMYIQTPDDNSAWHAPANKRYVDNINSKGYLTDFNSTAPVGHKGHILTYFYNPDTANRPSDCAEYGVVMYINGDPTSGTTDWTRQIILPNYYDYGNVEFHRQYINGSWQNWHKVTTQSQEVLLSTNQNGTYTVQDLRKWKYIIMGHKDSYQQWVTSIYPTGHIEDSQEFVLEDPAHNSWAVMQINGTSRTSVHLNSSGMQWFKLLGVS